MVYTVNSAPRHDTGRAAGVVPSPLARVVKQKLCSGIMPFVRAGQLARPTPTVRPDDPLGLVAENLRSSHYGAIPVLDRLINHDGPPGEGGGGRVLGLVEERDLSAAVLPVLEGRHAARLQAVVPERGPLGFFSSGGAARETASNGAPVGVVEPADANGYHAGANGHPPVPAPDLPPAAESGAAELDPILALAARDVMRTEIGVVQSAFSLQNALLTLDRYDSPALPVVDGMSAYIGMISRADVVAALGRQVRPEVIGGMATPLGVWLTTGRVTGGAPPLGLALAGATLVLCEWVARLVIALGLATANWQWALAFLSGRAADGPYAYLLNLGFGAVHGLLFLLLVRSLPISGYHAAEHQTVWAIEKGVPLTPEHVAKMPRPHPRCGTNLLVLAMLIEVVFEHLPSFDSGLVLAALFFIYVAWRNLGTLVQEWFTTKPATRKQLESGIKAGKEVLEKYQEQPQVGSGGPATLFFAGLGWTMLGGLVTFYLTEPLLDMVAQLLVPR